MEASFTDGAVSAREDEDDCGARGTSECLEIWKRERRPNFTVDAVAGEVLQVSLPSVCTRP